MENQTQGQNISFEDAVNEQLQQRSFPQQENAPVADATEETETTEETAEVEEDNSDAAPEYDYTGKIKLSAADTDAIDIEEAKQLVQDADINTGYKSQILAQIEEGKLSYQFAESIRRMRAAAAAGGIYRGGQDGL